MRADPRGLPAWRGQPSRPTWRRRRGRESRSTPCSVPPGGSSRTTRRPTSGSPRRGGPRVPAAPPHGRADYLLFVDGAAVGVIRAAGGCDADRRRDLGLRPPHQHALHPEAESRSATSTCATSSPPTSPRTGAPAPSPSASAVSPTTSSSSATRPSLDLIWLRDESLEDMENLPPPDVIAQEIGRGPRGRAGRVRRDRPEPRTADRRGPFAGQLRVARGLVTQRATPVPPPLVASSPTSTAVGGRCGPPLRAEQDATTKHLSDRHRDGSGQSARRGRMIGATR